MDENRVLSLRQKGAIDDPLTEILRTGARRLIAQAVEAEFEIFLASNAELLLSDGRRRVVRHGHDPVRAIQTGIGPVDVQRPKARDRGVAAAPFLLNRACSIRFSAVFGPCASMARSPSRPSHYSRERRLRFRREFSGWAL